MKVGIVGAGFTGTACAAVLHKLSHGQIEIVLCDKSGQFGAGPAYSTPFPYHLLNVRAQDMSAFEDDPEHFSRWLSHHPDRHLYFDVSKPIASQFAPRCLYYQYLQDLLATMQKEVRAMTLVADEVIDVLQQDNQVVLVLRDQRQITVDVVILALGNNASTGFPFPVAAEARCITNPWDYTAVKAIGKTDPVLIVGTGLSMIDAVLTLHHQQHQGRIYAVSRHGLLPLPHAEPRPALHLEEAQLKKSFPDLMKQLRQLSHEQVKGGGDWRSVIHELRTHIPAIWAKASIAHKKQFLRHLLPYWNIHRHRVHTEIMDLLTQLSREGRLSILSGHVMGVGGEEARIKLRYSGQEQVLPIKWLIHCMGPGQTMSAASSPLHQALLERGFACLDELQLGFTITPWGALKDANGQISTKMYALGPPTKGSLWEIGAVPEIRRQIFTMARLLLARR